MANLEFSSFVALCIYGDRIWSIYEQLEHCRESSTLKMFNGNN